MQNRLFSLKLWSLKFAALKLKVVLWKINLLYKQFSCKHTKPKQLEQTEVKILWFQQKITVYYLIENL